VAIHSKEGVVKALIAGIAANLGIGIAKFIAWFFSGSAAMLAESLHSIADSSNQGLLALGMKRADKAPTKEHPFGYGKERYFWAFLVAVIIFLLGAVFSIYEGIHKIGNPEPISSPGWIYFALTLGIVFEGYALKVAWGEFKHYRSANPGPLWEGLKATKDPTLPTVLFEDSAALVGLVVALVGVTMSLITGDAIYDGVASVVIGVVLLCVSWFLARESHSLLVGEGATPIAEAKIRDIVAKDKAIESTIELLTLHRGPEQLLIALTLEFRDGLRTGEIEATVTRLEGHIRDQVPEARYIFIETGSFRSSSN
jgi:cation diffusion facilitator family transporter